MTSPQYIRRSFIPGHALSFLHKATKLFSYDDSNHITPETISLTRPHELHHRCSYLSKEASRFILTKKEGFRLSIPFTLDALLSFERASYLLQYFSHVQYQLPILQLSSRMPR